MRTQESTGADPGACPETPGELFRPLGETRHHRPMSNTAARWTLVATLATTTLLTATLTTRLSSAPNPTPPETSIQTTNH